MRLIPIVAMLACLSAPAHARKDGRTITSDIEMSEWTPPMQLSLDLESGDYTIVPPEAPWPPLWPKPQRRSGTISGATLNRVPTAFDAAVASGVYDRRCVTGEGPIGGFIVSNGGIPQMSVTARGRQIDAPGQLICWTPAARALHKELGQTFDRKTPS